MADSIISLASARAVVSNYIPKNEQDCTIPLFQALLDHAPTEQGQRNICRQILECEEGAHDKRHATQRLQGLAEWYKFGLLVPMKTRSCRTPKASDCPSRTESTDQEVLDNLVVGEDIAVNQRDVKKAALCRDNHRSVLSGLVDEGSILEGLVPDTDDTTFTEAAHIIPFSLGNQNALVWTVLESFSGWEVASLLSGHQINRLENILTLTMLEHWAFGRLTGWLEPVAGEDDTYRVCSSRKHHDFPEGKVVHFTTTNSKLPLPDPRFIAIHAACAKVLHASGEMRNLYRMAKEYEEALVLAPDGSSEALDFALKALAARY
ncbi:hypothetical protein V565_069650 [Rhizoctonia solani 123E]|uniref:HNH nuclease domain-containing protein n=1 Tax=Rhizoctonia solani 123E TaxID=1423351 RepID=A0A074S083_9AGAM|nr:hypothetical protein V565_069650 [Rhizoctonia solani 123E]